MKKNNFLLMLIITFLSLNSQGVTDFTSVEIIPKNKEKIISTENSNVETKEEVINRLRLSKKRKEKVAAAFWGLVNAFSAIAQASTGNPQEAIPNFVGAALNTAAQIAQIEANYAKAPNLFFNYDKLVANLMEDFVEIIYNLISTDDRLITESDFILLSELKKIKFHDARLEWLAEKILDGEFVQAFLNEALDYLSFYLHKKIDNLITYLKETLLLPGKLEEDFN